MGEILDLGETVDTLLKEYPKQIRCLQKENASYVNPNRLRCTLSIDPNWAWNGEGEKCPVEHLTASEAIFAHNQMAYVLLTYMAQQGYMDGIKAQSLDNMNSKKFSKMVIREIIGLRFKKEIPTAQVFNAEFYVESQKLIRTPSCYLFVSRNRFNFEDKSAYGTTETVLKFNEDEIHEEIYNKMYSGKNI